MTVYDPREEAAAEAEAEARAEAHLYVTDADQDYHVGMAEDRYEKYMGW